MSGIVGILNLNRAPIDQGLLGRLTQFMNFRGPDAQGTWSDGHVGFGHTLLKTTEESEHEHQPFTLDGQTWILADARIDSQRDLIAELEARSHKIAPGITDVELVLRAYQVWDEDCVEHLLGDFAFAIWNGSRQRLFCARDHLGVKPFFYAHVGETIIFSNTLDCIRQHPAVSDKLNDLAIADFLLFDMNQDSTTTSFADIRRVPPAHYATWSESGFQMYRYWSLPTDEPVYFRGTDDYVDRFKDLLHIAIDDRLRTNKIGVFMSGGLDSTTLAAAACQIFRARLLDSEVRAFTTVIDGLDRNERYYAGLVAEHLGIRIHFWDRTDNMIDPHWDRGALHTPEPVANPMNLVANQNMYQSASSFARVWFYGEGPDNALHYEWRPYFSYLIKRQRLGRLIGDVCGHMLHHRRIPLLSTLPRMLKQRWCKRDWSLRYPRWIDEGLESRFHLRARWDEKEHSSPVHSRHPVRPISFGSFESLAWESFFRSLDAEESMVPFEVRHPFVDLRLLRFMLALPAVPWCREKYLLRRAMRGALPEEVLRRPKSPLTSDPTWEGACRAGLAPMIPDHALRRYVSLESVPKDAGQDMIDFRTNFRPLALNYWLRNLRHGSHHFTKEVVEYEFIT